MQTKIPAFTYQGGRDITEKLKLITNVNEFQDLADVFEIPRSTISTWHTRNMTPFEIVVRASLATGCSLRWLVLDEGEPFVKENSGSIEEIKLEKISNGLLVNDGYIKIDSITLERYGLSHRETRAINHDGDIYFINTSENNPTSGQYLINIDSNIMMNTVQRLPGKKLAVDFGNSTLEVLDTDISVIGRVAMIMSKE
ncbi:TPA: phage repressor protein CI [Photobacterium damselae]